MPWLNPRTRTYVLQFRVRGQSFSRQTNIADRRKADAAQKAWKEEEKAKFLMQEKNRDAKGKVRDVRIDDLVRDYWDTVGESAGDKKTRFMNLAILVDRIGPDRMVSDIDDSILTDLIAARLNDNDKRIKGKKLQPAKLRKDGKPRINASEVTSVSMRKISPAYVNRYVTQLLKTVLNFGVKRRKYHLPDMPDWPSHLLREPERQREMTHTEQVKLSEVIREDYAQAYDFALLTGLRRRQVTDLSWSEVDFDLMEVRVISKGQKPHQIPISPAMLVILKSQAKNHPIRVFTFIAQRDVRRNPKNGQGYVKGRRYPLNYQTFATMWARFGREAGVKNLKIHDLRHTFASRLLRQVKDLRIVQRALGHSGIATTTRYSHVLQEQIAEGMAAAERSNADIVARKIIQ